MVGTEISGKEFALIRTAFRAGMNDRQIAKELFDKLGIQRRVQTIREYRWRRGLKKSDRGGSGRSVADADIISLHEQTEYWNDARAAGRKMLARLRKHHPEHESGIRTSPGTKNPQYIRPNPRLQSANGFILPPAEFMG